MGKKKEVIKKKIKKYIRDFSRKEPYYDFYDYHRNNRSYNMPQMTSNNHRYNYTGFPIKGEPEFFDNRNNTENSYDEQDDETPSGNFDEYGFRKPGSNNSNNNNNREIQRKKAYGIFSFTITNVVIIGSIILYIIASICAGYIAWSCYAIDLRPVRIFKTIVASILSYPYLFYFFILRVMLKVPCF